MINRDIISVKENLYLVHRALRDNEKFDVSLLKEYMNCTHAFKQNGTLYMCREIETINYQEL